MIMEIEVEEEYPQVIKFRVFSKEEKFSLLEFAKNFTGRPVETHVTESKFPELPLDEDQHAVMEAISERTASGHRYSKITMICDMTKFDETKVSRCLIALERRGKIVSRQYGYGLAKKHEGKE